MPRDSNIRAYLPSTIKRMHRLAKLGISTIKERTQEQQAADLERFSYNSGGGGLQPRKNTNLVVAISKYIAHEPKVPRD